MNVRSLLLACVACAVLASVHPAIAADDPPPPDRSTRVAGQDLQLNGHGVVRRLMFKVYAIALYLSERRASADGVRDAAGPRRVAIRLLRDVRGADIAEAVTDAMADPRDGPPPAPGCLAELQALGRALSARAEGLRRGDALTLDWVPGTGAVISLNERRLIAPVADRAFYNALLDIWLGARAGDPGLASRLLGQAPERLASAR